MKSVTFKKFDNRKQIVYAEVYSPMIPDSQGDFMTMERIEKMAHEFLKNGNTNSVDIEHSLEKCGATVVESFIVRKGDPDFIEGSWVLGVHIPDNEIWAKVEKGEINGFSMYGTGVREERVLEFEIPDNGEIRGVTADHGDHVHEFVIKFAEDGTFLGGETNEVDGHKHAISKGTVTDVKDGHSHRYALVDALIKHALLVGMECN